MRWWFRDRLGLSADPSPDAIGFDSLFLNDLGVDSLDVAGLIMELEAQCDVVIYDEDAMKIRSHAGAIRQIIEASDEAAQTIGIATSDWCGASHADAGRGTPDSLQG